MSKYNLGHINWFIAELEKGNMKPDELVKDEFSEITLIQIVINIDNKFIDKLGLIKKLINLGCNVDQYGAHMTAISMAASGSSTGSNIELVEFLLQYHEKGHRSDLDILKSSAGSLDKDMFETVLKSNKVDTNVTQMRGSHILHHLADIDDFAPLIDMVWQYAPETIPNPIHRKGYSPLTLALNNNAIDCVLAIAKNKNAKIIGDLENPIAAIDAEVTDRYENNFWIDFKDSNIIEYTIKNKKEHLLPSVAQDVFLF